MAIANGTCVSFCNQPKAHFCFPLVRPWDNRGKCYMDEKRIRRLSNASQQFGPQKTRIMGLPGSEDSLMIG